MLRDNSPKIRICYDLNTQVKHKTRRLYRKLNELCKPLSIR